MGNSRYSRAAYRAALLAGVCACTPDARAQSATWLANPPNNNYGDGSNWSGGHGSGSTPIFGATTKSNINVESSLTLDSFTFNSGAPAYVFVISTPTRGDLRFEGAGVVNNSSNSVEFFVAPNHNSLTFANASSAANSILGASQSEVNFRNTSTAANMTISAGPFDLNFFNSSTAANATILAGNPSQGQLTSNAVFHDNSRAGNALIILNNGSAIFRNNSSADNAHIINMTTNNQQILFTETSTAGNATIDNIGSSVRFSELSNAGTAKIANESVLLFFGSSSAANATVTSILGTTLFFGESTGGQARFILGNNALIDISRLISSGTALGSVEGLGTVALGSKSLTIGTNNLSTVFGGVFADGGPGGGVGGSLIKVGAGTLTLNGANTYTGPTVINGGTLAVNGSILSAVTVGNGGTLGGTGTVGPTFVTSGGVLSPGNSIGTININGNLILGAGSIFHVEVSPTNSDRVNVTGAAVLGGTAELVFAPGSYTSNVYTILSAAGGRLGAFDAVTTSGLPPALTASLTYTPTDVLLMTLTSQMALFGNTPNQKAVAAAQDAAFNSGKPAITALFNLSPGQLPGAFDQLSGEVHPSTAGVLLDESLYARSAVLGRLRQASYGPDSSMASLSVGGPQAFANGEELSALAYGKSPIVTKAPRMVAPPAYDVTFWAQGFGAWGRFDSDGNAAAVRRNLAGFFTGADTRVGASGRLGVMTGYTASSNTLDGRGGANVETGHLAGYGGWSVGAFNLRGGGAFAWHTVDASRAVNFPGFFDSLTAHYEGRTGQIFGELGYGFVFGKVAVEPFAGVAWVRVQTDGFNERGGAAALTIAANSFNAGYSTLGVRAASLIPLSADVVLVPRASLAWQHAFDSVTPVGTLAFQSAAVPFTVAGVPIARDSLLGEAGLDLAIGRHATVGVSYTGQLARNVHDHAAKGKFAWKF